MSYLQVGSGRVDVAVCQYEQSRLWFRGPEKRPDKSSVVCVGGDETFGRFVDQPFPSVLEGRVGKCCVNLGSLFAGAEALVRDQGILNLVNGSGLCVLQIPGLAGQSNPFYRVHPRRNDRFLEPTRRLVDLYPEVDFTEFHFVKHLLTRLLDLGAARFALLAQGLQDQWCQSLQSFLERVGPPVILLWLRVHRQSPCDVGRQLQIDRPMVEQFRSQCAGIVELSVSVAGASDELEDVLFGTLQQPMAEHMIGPAAHRAIADALVPVIQDLN